MKGKHQHSNKRKSISAAIVAVVVAAHIYSNYLHDLGQAQERISSGSKVVETPCGPIEYAVAGPDDGPPVLVVHGIGGGFDQGLMIGRPLAARGFRTIAPSRFGYLGTPFPEPQKVSLSAQADAHACLLDALNINKAAVFGVSAGAPSSLKFAQKHPDRCTSLILSVPGLDEANFQLPFGLVALDILGVFRYNFLYWAAIKLARPVMIRMAFGTPPGLYYKASDSEKALMDEILYQMLPVSARSEGMKETCFEPINDMEQIKVPTLTISHKDDLFGTYKIARAIADRIPGARFVGYPDGGHMSIGYSDQVYSEIVDFLKEHK